MAVHILAACTGLVLCLMCYSTVYGLSSLASLQASSHMSSDDCNSNTLVLSWVRLETIKILRKTNVAESLYLRHTHNVNSNGSIKITTVVVLTFMLI